MSIQIIENFQVNTAKPIDNRIVASGSVAREAIAYKYEGLRVFDTADKIAYVYLNGAWVSEAAASGGNNIGLSGTQNTLLYFNTANTVGSSNIYFTGGKIGIGVSSPTVALDVLGDVKANSFNGSGVSLTNLNADKIIGDPGLYTGTINSNKLDFKFIQNSLITGQVLTTTTDGVAWATIDSVPTKIKVLNDNTTLKYLAFVDVTNSDPKNGNSVYYNNTNSSKAIAVNPSTSQLLASSANDNVQLLPAYSFISNTSTGLYGNNTNIGLSFIGRKRLEIDGNTLRIFDPSGSNVLTATANGINFGPGTGNNAFIKSQISGSQTSPDYTWQGDLTTGIYRSNSSEISFTSAGSNKVSITTNGLVVKSGFQLTTGAPGLGKSLVSDANGNGTWQTLLTGVPYGSVIMWLSVGSIPIGWKVCLASGDTKKYIFLNDRYYLIPDMRDRLISGDTTMTGIWSGSGTISPTIAATFSIEASNLPPHTHDAGSLKPRANGDTFIKFGFDDNGVNTQIGNGVRMSSQSSPDWEGTVTGGLKWDLSITGSTGDGLFSKEAIKLPITKYVGMIFIIKYNPSATQETEGYVTNAATAITYNNSIGIVDNPGDGFTPPGGGPIGSAFG